jgi:uncharacterized RmlC-like cupin family protein
MASASISVEQMQKRIARFGDLVPIRRGFLDTAIPGHARDVFNVIGGGVTEDQSVAPAIADARDFNLTYVRAEPGNGAALHDHETVEVFIPLTGRFAIIWGEHGEHEVELSPFDVISVPPGVMRGFRCVHHEAAYLLAIQGGSDPGRVTYADEVLARAQELGIKT